MSDTEDTKQGLIDAVEGDKAKGDATDKKADDTPKFTQADVDRLIKERLDRADKKAKEAQDKARQEAETKALEEQGEFKKLNEGLKGQLAEYEPLKAQLEDATSALNELLETELANVPDYVLEALEDKTPAQKLRYIAKNKEKWVATEDKGKAANIRSYPPNGKSSNKNVEEVAAADLRKSGQYRI